MVVGVNFAIGLVMYIMQYQPCSKLSSETNCHLNLGVSGLLETLKLQFLYNLLKFQLCSKLIHVSEF